MGKKDLCLKELSALLQQSRKSIKKEKQLLQLEEEYQKKKEIHDYIEKFIQSTKLDVLSIILPEMDESIKTNLQKYHEALAEPEKTLSDSIISLEKEIDELSSSLTFEKELYIAICSKIAIRIRKEDIPVDFLEEFIYLLILNHSINNFTIETLFGTSIKDFYELLKENLSSDKQDYVSYHFTRKNLSLDVFFQIF